MMDVGYHGDVLRIFIHGMYAMQGVLFGVSFVRKAKGSVIQDARLTYRLAYVCFFLMVLQNFMGLFIEDALQLDYQPHTWVIIEHLLTLSDLLIVPFAGLLVIHLTHCYEVGPKRIASHLAPFVLLFICYFFSYEEALFQLSYYLSIAYAAAIYLLAMSRVYIYQKTLHSTYDNPGNRSLRWVYWFINLLLVQNVLYYQMPEALTSDLPRTIYYIVSIANWWLMGEMVQRQVLEVDEMKEKLMNHRSMLSMPWSEHEGDNVTNNIPANENRIDKAMQRLCAEERIYLDPDLTCNDLAKAVGTNRTYMSLWFREHGTTFNDYINALRLKYAEYLLRATDDNILSVGSKSGFSHPNTFRNVFKEHYGCTPTEYRKGKS